MDDGLTGIRVLDLSDGVAGAFCTKLLAMYGVTVIKVEPPSGDPTRSAGPFPKDIPDTEQSGLFLYLNTDKRGITLDLTSSAGAAAFRRLAQSADIIVESFTPGTLSALQLGYEDLKELNPRLIMTSLTPFGQTGMYSDYQSTHLINCASSGWMYTIGEPDREPLQSGGLVSDYAAGLHGAIGSLAAYFDSALTGQGCEVDVSTQEALQIVTIYGTTRCSYSGDIPKRSGTHFPWMIAPCRDGLIGCSILTDGQWEALCAWIQPEWLGDPRLSTVFGRREHRDEIEATLLEFFQQHTRDELFYEGQARRIPVNPVPLVDELLQFEQHRDRGYFVEIEHPIAGSLTYPGLPFKTSARPPRRMQPAPLLGQDNDAIFCQELGYHADELPTLMGGGKSAAEPIRPVKRSSRPSTMTAPRSLPLKGVRVLDLTWVMAGPVATSMLADLGAEVLKVEAIQVLDRWRGAATLESSGLGTWELSPSFNTLNRNKQGITLNLADPSGAAILRDLLQTCDIVAENYTPRVMQNFGLDYQKLAEIKPDLIMLSMPGFGLTGPWRDFVSFAFPTEETSGIVQLTGYHGGPPQIMGNGSCDALAGLNGAVALLLALEHRRRTGQGQHIDLSQMEACTSLIGEVVLDYEMNGRVTERRGNRHHSMAPHGVYRSRGEDQWIAIAIRSDTEWKRFGQELGAPAWVSDERFRTTAGRLQYHDEIDEQITAWTSVQARLAVMQRLQAAGIPASAVFHAADLLMNPHLRERGFFEWVNRAGDGGHWYPRQPIQLSSAVVGTRLPAPTLGEHTEAVLQRLLAMEPQELEGLANANITGTMPLGV
jgi:crotonobetainyl-CoA:carnitine CoA-transferase CaiB-like acyl-CoA transferase